MGEISEARFFTIVLVCGVVSAGRSSSSINGGGVARINWRRDKEDENLRFRYFLKTRCELEPDRIDQGVFETTQRVWAGIDCTACANCCRETKPTFSQEEVDRVALRFGMRRREFIETYLERSEAGSENPWRTRTTHCPFLKENLCSIYEKVQPSAGDIRISTNRISCSAHSG
jgi:hypothetical protein